jgi:hypothetical protein
LTASAALQSLLAFVDNTLHYILTEVKLQNHFYLGTNHFNKIQIKMRFTKSCVFLFLWVVAVAVADDDAAAPSPAAEADGRAKLLVSKQVGIFLNSFYQNSKDHININFTSQALLSILSFKMFRIKQAYGHIKYPST